MTTYLRCQDWSGVVERSTPSFAGADGCCERCHADEWSRFSTMSEITRPGVDDQVAEVCCAYYYEGGVPEATHKQWDQALVNHRRRVEEEDPC